MNFQYDCVNPKSKEELEFIIDNGEEITFKEFESKVNNDDFELLISNLGYSEDFPIDGDRYVQYNRSKKQDGQTVYYMVHSAIEYVFYKLR